MNGLQIVTSPQWMLTSGILPALSAVSRYKNSKQNTKVKNHISVREEGRKLGILPPPYLVIIRHYYHLLLYKFAKTRLDWSLEF